MKRTLKGEGDRRRRAAALLVATVISIGIGVASAPAQAAPRDNLNNARRCLQGGWRTLTTSDGRSFRNLGQCVVYALRGGQFPVSAPPGGGGE